MPQLADIFMARSKLPNQWHSNFLAQYHMPEQPHVLVDAPGGVLMRQKNGRYSSMLHLDWISN
jgi:hypothetical protein